MSDVDVIGDANREDKNSSSRPWTVREGKAYLRTNYPILSPVLPPGPNSAAGCS